LRLEILRRRLDLTERVLNEALEGLQDKDSALGVVFFGEARSESEKGHFSPNATEPKVLR
jgi:hypothetical protein